MSHYKNIVIVGTNNTTRSYMAEAVFKRLAEEYDLEDITIVSRGLVVLFPEPVNPKAAQAVGNAGYKIKEFQATKFTKEDLEEADLILTITPEEKDRILTDYEGYVKDSSPIYTLSEFAGEKIGIPNPYGKEAEEYAACFITVKRMCEKCFENRILKK